jgi:uncharacterized membrane protein YhaH (DUF805 family)
VENIAPWLPAVALVVLVACGGRWRRAAWWLAGIGVVVFVVALGVGFLMGEPDCEDGLCAEYVPFFVGLFLEIALGAIAVLLAVAAVIVRVARAP